MDSSFFYAFLLLLLALPLTVWYYASQRAATGRKQANVLRRQYYLLIACLLLVILRVLTNQSLLGLPVSILLIYLAITIFQYRVTVVPIAIRGIDPPDANSRKEYHSGPRATPVALLYLGLALILLLDAVMPYLRPSYGQNSTALRPIGS
jgi:hypothetical protein